MEIIAPTTAEALADVLRQCAAQHQTITLAGNKTKLSMAGPVLPSDVSLSTTNLRRVLQYERNDLTISVEAGLPFSQLQSLLGKNHQMVALDPGFQPHATVGGVVATNSSGPMRRAFGTARDLIIGMTFATLDGKLIRTGGMVVKNVAGLDMGKLMIGSFGTLAAITSVNFRVHSRPVETATFLFNFSAPEQALAKRNNILQGALQPLAIDLVNPVAAARLGVRGYTLAIRAGGSHTVLQRYSRELASGPSLTGAPEKGFWRQLREFTPDFMHRQTGGIVLRISTSLRDMSILLKMTSGACIARAASGVTYVYLTKWQLASPFLKAARERKWTLAVEFAPDEVRTSQELWPLADSPGGVGAFAMMSNVKKMFDPGFLLNRSRLYGRI